MVTGLYDREAQGVIPEDIPENCVLDAGLIHIIPLSLGGLSNIAEVYQSRVWNILYTCFPGILDHANLSPDNINDPSNLMMMVSPLHTCFREFNFALEPTVGIIVRVLDR